MPTAVRVRPSAETGTYDAIANVSDGASRRRGVLFSLAIPRASVTLGLRLCQTLRLISGAPFVPLFVDDVPFSPMPIPSRWAAERARRRGRLARPAPPGFGVVTA